MVFERDRFLRKIEKKKKDWKKQNQVQKRLLIMILLNFCRWMENWRKWKKNQKVKNK